ncbi:hypothetical protein BZA77DRAFT_319719 [Pyronema omphalodes]|nr:hypothetical protein BZA77DRAFT_319719 [Pyronema omphalodes]
MKQWLKTQTSSSTASAPAAPAVVTTVNGTLFQNSTIHSQEISTNVTQPVNPAVHRDQTAGPAVDHTPASKTAVSRERVSSLLTEQPESELESSQNSEYEEDEEEGTVAFGVDDVYHGFEKDRVWKLEDGTIVEDVLYKNNPKLPQDKSTVSLLRRGWIIDLDNSTMESWFTTSEWNEIKAAVPPLPSPSEHFGRSLMRFHSVKTVEDLRNVLETTSYRPEGIPYNRELHFDSAWADNVIRSFLVLFDTPGQPLGRSHLENWYASYIWSPIIDQCFLSLPDMTFESADSVCRATSLRKNRTRTDPTGRAKNGSRLDGILRSVEDDSLEFFCMEIASTFQGGVTSTKWLGDSHKLVRAMRDMLGRVVQRGGKQVVGVVAAGLTLEVWRMYHFKGYTCVLKRERIQTVPSKVERLTDLLVLLSSVVRMKAAVRECVEAVRASREVQSPEELYFALMSGRDATPPSGRTVLPWPTDTP